MGRHLFHAALCVTLVFSAAAQQQPAKQLAWDVTSVKPMPASSCAGGGGVQFLPNGLSASCVTAIFAVEFAYQLMDTTRILGLPKWANGPQNYSIEGRVAAQDAAAFSALPRREQASMMQSILSERFGLRTHLEVRELPACRLILARGGSKLKPPSQTVTSSSQFARGTGEVQWSNAPLTNLKFLLAEETGRPVVDSTGLTGNYDFTLEYTPANRAATDQSAARPSIFTALQEQLGMKLVAAKQPVDVLVTDFMHEPSPD